VAAAYAAQRGIILADTKLEFGREAEAGRVLLADEIFTPDSSRFWPADACRPYPTSTDPSASRA
jgi:phosphoribosylaminoimidazole-succinocarboxamide synthase